MVIVQTSYPDLLYRGKVRDTYDLGDGLLLMVATDRVSAFDVVLPSAIPYKGLVLSQMSAFWFRKSGHLVLNHLVGMASEPEVKERLSHTLVAQLPARVARQAMVIKRAKRINIECVVRGYLAGSAWAEYSTRGTISGMKLPPSLVEGSQLPAPLFTPTTKAERGHDETMTCQQVVDTVGPSLAQRLEETSLAVYQFAHEYALRRGIIVADTKLEFGLLDGELILIDELLTPDSSRFWDASSYRPGRSQPNFDKQFVRDWLTASGWNREPPAPPLPRDIVEKTSQRYLEAYRRLTGQSLELEGV